MITLGPGEEIIEIEDKWNKIVDTTEK